MALLRDNTSEESDKLVAKWEKYIKDVYGVGSFLLCFFSRRCLAISKIQHPHMPAIIFFLHPWWDKGTGELEEPLVFPFQASNLLFLFRQA